MLSAILESVTSQSILVGIVVCLAAYFLLKKRYKLPPGPTALPLLGNALAFRSQKMQEVIYKWSKVYGPVITIYFGPLRCVVLNSVETVTEAMVKKADDYAGRPHSYTLHSITDGGKDVAFADFGPHWKVQRRLAVKALRQYMTGVRLDSKIQSSLECVCDVIHQQKGALDIARHISFLVYNLLCGVLVGKIYEINDPQFARTLGLFESFSQSFGKGLWEDVIPPLRLWPTKRFREIIKITSEIEDFFEQHINQHKEVFKPDEVKDVIDSLLLALSQDEEFKELAGDDNRIKQIVNNLFGAGIDTSRQTLTFAIFYLAICPKVQAKVHQELDEALGLRRFPTLADKPNLVYTEATLHETMRLSSIVPLGLPHKTTKDTTIGDYEVPAGTMVLINLWALHRDPAYWTDPEDFRPERFLDAQGQMAQKPPAWLPFSAGRRVCLGENVAKPELLLLLAGLLRNFHFAFPLGEKHSIRDETSLGFFVQPPRFSVVATPRYTPTG